MKNKFLKIGFLTAASMLFLGASSISFSNANKVEHRQIVRHYADTVLNEDEQAALDVEDFVNSMLHYNDINPDDTGEGKCKEYYKDAKKAYKNLSEKAKEIFATDEKYSDARARFQVWANNSGEVIDFENHEIHNPKQEKEYPVKVIVTVSALVLAGGAGALFFIKKPFKK